jgi:hypothetical protein
MGRGTGERLERRVSTRKPSQYATIAFTGEDTHNEDDIWAAYDERVAQNEEDSYKSHTRFTYTRTVMRYCDQHR